MLGEEAVGSGLSSESSTITPIQWEYPYKNLFRHISSISELESVLRGIREGPGGQCCNIPCDGRLDFIMPTNRFFEDWDRGDDMRTRMLYESVFLGLGNRVPILDSAFQLRGLSGSPPSIRVFDFEPWLRCELGHSILFAGLSRSSTPDTSPPVNRPSRFIYSKETLHPSTEISHVENGAPWRRLM